MAESSITEASLTAALVERLKATHVEVTDMSGGCGQAFISLVVSSQFAGKRALKRHQLVNEALRSEIAQIHAWSAKCQTPEEWERDRAAAGAGVNGTNGINGTNGPPLDGTVGGRVAGVGE